MAFFRRRRSPDPTFTFLTSAQGEHLRALVARAFDAAGRPVTVHPAHVVDGAGREFGIADLAAQCFRDERGEAAWPDAVTQHVHTVLALADAPSPFEALPAREVLAGTHLRVLPVAETVSRAYARPVGPGLAAVLALDLPDSVTFLNDEHVVRYGAAAAWEAGRANLRALRTSPPEVVGDAPATFHAVFDDSYFTASQVVVLDELLARHGFVPDPVRGVFVALPSRNLLAFHVVADGSAIPALDFMARYAPVSHERSMGPLSPAVYWWRPGSELVLVAQPGPTNVQVSVDPELQAVLEGLV